MSDSPGMSKDIAAVEGGGTRFGDVSESSESTTISKEMGSVEGGRTSISDVDGSAGRVDDFGVTEGGAFAEVKSISAKSDNPWSGRIGPMKSRTEVGGGGMRVAEVVMASEASSSDTAKGISKSTWST